VFPSRFPESAMRIAVAMRADQASQSGMRQRSRTTWAATVLVERGTLPICQLSWKLCAALAAFTTLAAPLQCGVK
jgi:hypothetical protein